MPAVLSSRRGADTAPGRESIGWDGLRAFTEAHFGVAARSEALRFVRKDALRRALDAGRLVEPFPDVVAFARPQTMRGWWRAANLSSGRALFGTSALQAHRVLELEERFPIHVVGTSGSGRSSERLHVHRAVAVEHVALDGLVCTPLDRSILDGAMTLPAPLVERAITEALARRRLVLRQLDRVIADAGKHPGRRKLTDVLDVMREGTGITRSEGEVLLRDLLRELGITGFELNRRIGRFEYDVVFPELRLVIELQSFSFHATARNQDRDARKAVAAQDAGLRLLPITARQLVRDRDWLATTLTRWTSSRPGADAAPGGESI